MFSTILYFPLSSYTYFPFISWFTIVENLFGGQSHSHQTFCKWVVNTNSEDTHFLIADYFEQDVILIILSHSSFWVTFHFEQLYILIIMSKMSFWSYWARCHFDYFEQHFILSNISFWATFHSDHFEQILVLVIVSKFSFAQSPMLQ